MQRQSTTTFYKQTDAQPVPEHQQPPTVVLLSRMWFGMEYFLGQCRTVVSLVLCQCLGQPSLHAAGYRMRQKEILDAVQAIFSRRQNTGVLPGLFYTNPKHSTIMAAMKKVNFTPVRPSTAMHLMNTALLCLFFLKLLHLLYVLF